MPDKLTEYKRADTPLPQTNRLWPLYGAGFENLGRDGQPIEVPMPRYGPDELLVRHDANGLCFSDIKVIKTGEEHPRIRRNMRENPVVLGHEIAITVVGVGANLRDKFHVGDRFIVQADIYVQGVNYAYGYEIQGGLSRYGVIDQRILNGDDGCYLIPLQPTTGYAEAALAEPWACVIAAYQLQYRTTIKPGGTMWLIGTPTAKPNYLIGAGFDEVSHPARVLLTNVPADFAARLRTRASKLGVEVVEVAALANPPAKEVDNPHTFLSGVVDDIVLLGADADILEQVSPRLANHGIVAIIADQPFARPVQVDIGRIHYNDWVYVGGRGPDIARAYSDVPTRSTLQPGGRAWIVGAGGPMGHMHVQRALALTDRPATIVCSDISDARLSELRTTFAAEAQSEGIEFVCLNPLDKAAYQAGMAPFKESGFDDIVALAAVPAVISDAATYLAPRGVLNIFAGVARGTMAALDLSDAYLKDARVIGHTSSTISDLRQMLDLIESDRLSTNRSVAAIGSLSAARDGLKALHDTVYPGKVVIFPNIKELPLTALPDLKDRLPTVYAKLKDGHEWTLEAEEEFLRLMALT